MGDGEAAILAALITLIGVIIVAIFSLWSKRSEEASVLTGDALEMYKEVKASCELLKKQVATLQQIGRIQLERIGELERQLAEEKIARQAIAEALGIAEANINFLLEYMKRNGLEIPDLKYRGDDLPFAQRKD